MGNKRFFFVLALVCAFGAALSAIDTRESDARIAGRYVDWARAMADAGRWTDARAGLERALDFADASSDIPYLLARARIRTGQDRAAALEAAGLALDTNRWARYSEEDGLLLRARLLVAMRRFSAALGDLSRVSPRAEKSALTLAALRGLNDRAAFAREAAAALDVYSRDPDFVRLIFAYYEDKLPQSPAETALIDVCRRRLPVLLETAPDLAYRAVPFIAHTDEAARLVGAYLAESKHPSPCAASSALSLGIIDEIAAVDLLFAQTPDEAAAGHAAASTIDKTLLLSVWNLCTDRGRAALNAKLFSWTGALTEDADKDGIIETLISYKAGRLSVYREDADQDGIGELVILFDGGVPSLAECRSAEGTIALHWEQYPAARSAFLNGVRFVPKPADFFYEPVRFAELTAGGVLFPQRNPDRSVLTRQTLVAASGMIERPSAEFPGAVEYVELRNSVPLRAREYLNGVLVSETAYVNGKPVRQKVDLDLNGAMETTRFF